MLYKRSYYFAQEELNRIKAVVLYTLQKIKQKGKMIDCENLSKLLLLANQDHMNSLGIPLTDEVFLSKGGSKYYGTYTKTLLEKLDQTSLQYDENELSESRIKILTKYITIYTDTDRLPDIKIIGAKLTCDDSGQLIGQITNFDLLRYLQLESNLAKSVSAYLDFREREIINHDAREVTIRI